MQNHRSSSFLPVGVFVAATAVAFLAISPSSLWIDEAHSAWKATTATPPEFWHTFCADTGSDQQMPLYMVLLWLWEKLVGKSEFMLRALNIPFFVAANTFVAWRLKAPRALLVIFAAFACTSPFIWAYLNEARPYILQFFAACLIMVPLANLATSIDRPASETLWCFATGIVLLCASSLIGFLFSCVFMIAYVSLWLMRERVAAILYRRDFWMVLAGGFVCLAALGAFYLWTFHIGAKASDVGATGLLSICFCVYELLGFAGLGPGRSDLRQFTFDAIRPYLLFLSLYAVILIALLLSGVSTAKKTPLWKIVSPNIIRKCIPFSCIVLVCTVVVSCLVLLLVGYMGHVRIIGRHFMPVFPLMLLVFSWMSMILWNYGNYTAKGLLIVAVLFSGISAMTLRFSPAHAKDDYREAAATAKEAIFKNKKVWWAADPAGAYFYNVYPVHVGETGSVFFANSRSAEYLNRLPAPHTVLLSKIDIYDKHGTLAAYLSENGYKNARSFPAFTVWEK